MKNAPNLFSSAMYTVLTEVWEYNLSSVEKNASVIAVSYITEKKKAFKYDSTNNSPFIYHLLQSSLST